jgi:hypothetical protein
MLDLRLDLLLRSCQSWTVSSSSCWAGLWLPLLSPLLLLFPPGKGTVTRQTISNHELQNSIDYFKLNLAWLFDCLFCLETYFIPAEVMKG